MRFGRFSVPWPVAKTGVFEIWYLGPDFEQNHLSHEFYLLVIGDARDCKGSAFS